MTDAEIFNREITRLGLGYRKEISPDHPARKGYEHIRNIAEELIASAKENLPRLPDIHFDFIYKEDINAVAFKSEGRYFIGLTTGTIYMLELVIMRMLSDSHLFDTIGNPSEEANDLTPLVGYLPKAEQMNKAGFRPKRPKTKPRLSYAWHLIDQALLFLVGHEIAHITLGHVDYMQSKAGTALVAELGWNAPTPDGLIERQCLETQADMRSVISRIASLKLTYIGHASGNSEIFPWLDSNPSEAHLIFDWAFAMNLLFRLFGDVRFNTSQLATNPYPPLPLRRVMATTIAYGAVMGQWNPTLKEKALHALQTAMKYSEHAFAAVLGEKISTEGLADAYSPLGREHHKCLMKYSFELQKQLAPFSYETIFDLGAPPTTDGIFIRTSKTT
jgi:hypothetical protein